MEKIKKILISSKTAWAVMIMSMILICVYYGRKVGYIYTLWELADEYGYLLNAAYFTKTDWSYLTSLYYGYGYSILLIPLFIFWKAGIDIIRGAIWVNILCIIILLWVQYILMSKLFPTVNRSILAITSSILCFQPYLVANSLKVVPECLLTLMIWVDGLLLYQALKSGKKVYYSALAMALVYTFFVHTRSIIFCAVLIAFIFVMFLMKKINKKNILYFSGVGIVLFIGGTILKNHLINNVYMRSILGGETVGNTLELTDVINKIISLITDFSNLTIDSFAAKIFYLFVATAGLCFIGFYASIRDWFKEIKNNKNFEIETGIKVMYGIALALMVIGLVVYPMGQDEGTAHYFYARYYEYLMGPITFIGATYCIEKKQTIGVIIMSMLTLTFGVVMTFDLTQYLDTSALYYDSARIPAFSYYAVIYEDFLMIIKNYSVWVIGFIVATIVLNRIKSLRWIIPFMLIVTFLRTDKIIVDMTIVNHAKNTSAYAVAEFMEDKPEEVNVYYLGRSIEHEYVVYTNIQSMLGKTRLNVILPEDMAGLKSGDLVVSGIYNPNIEYLYAISEKIFETSQYALYYIN